MHIFDARNSTNLLAVFGSIIVLVFVFWGYGETFASMNKQKSVDEQLEIWESSLPNSYQYQLSFGCMFATHLQVSVLNGVHYFKQTGNTAEPVKVKLVDLFAVVEKARHQAYTVSTTFHDVYGFPTTIEIDWKKNTIDDECFYEVSEFESYET